MFLRRIAMRTGLHLKMCLIYKNILIFVLISVFFLITYLLILKNFLTNNKCLLNDMRIFGDNRTKPSKVPDSLLMTIFNGFLNEKEQCYTKHNLYENETDFVMFSDLLKDDRKPKINQTIFFLETSCSVNHEIYLNNRKGCAIESAALMNPFFDVFVVFASPVGLWMDLPNNPVIESLKQYPNIFFRNLNVWEFAKKTFTYDWIQTNKLFQSKYLQNNLSNFLRLLLLYKYGGIYLDLDIIVKTDFTRLETNFVCAEDSTLLNNAVMKMSTSETSKQLLEKIIRYFMKNYNGYIWANNGPKVISDVVRKECKFKNETVGKLGECSGVTIYPPKFCYPVHYSNANYLFEANLLEKGRNMTKHSYVVHIWNKLTHNTTSTKGDRSLMDDLSKEFCPRLYEMDDPSL